jgi:hypothetical protein
MRSPSVLPHAATFNMCIEYLYPAHHKEPVIVNKVVEDRALDRAYAALAARICCA